MTSKRMRDGFKRSVADGGRGRAQGGMTLPEILVALTILAILFGLLFVPLMKTFGYIRTGNVRISAQDIGRNVVQAMIREINDATYIYDNVDDPTQSQMIVVLPNGLATNDSQPPPGSPLAPSTAPILLFPGPGVSGSSPVLVQYGIGLADPGRPYACQYALESREVAGAALPLTPDQPDNLYQLWRTEYYGDNACAFREPGYLDDSLLVRPRYLADSGNAIFQNPLLMLANSAAVALRRQQAVSSGAMVALTPRVDVDMAQAVLTPTGGSAV
jgi:prepilin-type N-terminal cleavage/methylation domain-containing protein